MGNTQTIKTEYEFCPNPQAIRLKTTWNTRLHEPLKYIIESVGGVAGISMWGLYKYSFSVYVGELFDTKEVADTILRKIEEYFAD